MNKSSLTVSNTTVSGPGFVSLLVRDVAAAGDFYEHKVGLKRDSLVFPGAVAFLSTPIPFAVRQAPEGMTIPPAEMGIAVWFKARDAQAAYESFCQNDVKILKPPFDGPFGRTFVFADLDGYAMTIYEQDVPIAERLPK